MIRELFEKIREALMAMEGEPVRHIYLWNRNVEFIEQEAAWERPAVFLEFEPVKWHAHDPGFEYHCQPRVRLHVVTDWAPEALDRDDERFRLTERIHRQLRGLSGPRFYGLDLVESVTNHDHEDILDTVEIYSCDASRIFEE